MLAVLGAALLVGYLIRAAVLLVLTAGSPLAFACHALPQTEGVAKLWWRAVFGCVAVQTLQALVLITAVQVFFDPRANTILGLPNGGTLMDLLICLCLFTVLLKIPGWVRRIVMGRSPFHSSPLSGFARQLVFYQGVRAAAPYLGMAIRHRLFPTPPRPMPPAPPTPGTGLAPRHPGPGPRPGGAGDLGGWRPGPETVTVTQTSPGSSHPPGPAEWTSSASESQLTSPTGPPNARRPPRPHGPPERTALPPVPTPPQLPPGPFGRMLTRTGPELCGRQMGLFPRPAPTVQPEMLLPPAGPSAARGQSGVVRPALFSPTTLAPLPHATPPKSSTPNPHK